MRATLKSNSRSNDVTQGSHTHISSVLLWCWFTHIVRIRAFSIAITRGLRHNAKVCEPIQGCDCDFRDVRDIVLEGSDVRLKGDIDTSTGRKNNNYDCYLISMSAGQQKFTAKV